MARVLRGLAENAAASMQQISETVVRRIAQSQSDALMKHALLVVPKWALQTQMREPGVRKTTTDAEINEKAGDEMRRRSVRRGD